VRLLRSDQLKGRSSSWKIEMTCTQLSRIIVYDNLQGGAALVARPEDEDVILRCLGATCSRVDGRRGSGVDESFTGASRATQTSSSYD